MSEKAILAALSADNVRAHVEHICNDMPSRLAGSDNQRRMAEYSAKNLREAGIAVTVHTLPGLVSYPERAEFKVLSPVALTIEANTLGHSTQTPPAGVTGELLDVHTGAFEEYEGKDVPGTITLSELSYHPARHEKQRIAGLVGAAGCVMMNWGAPDNRAVPFGSVKPAWGNPTSDNVATEMPTLPCIGIARTDGLRLRELCRQGPVRVWLRTHFDNGWGPFQIPTAQISVAASEDFVIVGGHQDSWFGEAATDNAAGNACILVLARVFNQHKELLRRGLVVGFWPATRLAPWSALVVRRSPLDRLRPCAAYFRSTARLRRNDALGTRSNVELRGSHEAIERRLRPVASTWRRGDQDRRCISARRAG